MATRSGFFTRGGAYKGPWSSTTEGKDKPPKGGQEKNRLLISLITSCSVYPTHLIHASGEGVEGMEVEEGHISENKGDGQGGEGRWRWQPPPATRHPPNRNPKPEL